MATPMDGRVTNTVKQTFSYCELCRHSHDRGKKHAFSRRHRDKLKAVLSKYDAKVKLAKQDMKEPCLLTGSFEPDTNYWCYMCACEVHKHISDGEVTVRHAGFIEHLMSTEHAQKVDRFWRVNRIETALQAKYIFSGGAQGAYKKAVEEALMRYEEKEERVLSQSAAKIRRLESNRTQLLQPSDGSTSIVGASETLAASSRIKSNGDLDSTVGSTAPAGNRRASEASESARSRPRDGGIYGAPSCSSWSNHQTAGAQNQGVMPYTAELHPNTRPAVSGCNRQDTVGTSFSQFQATGKSTVAGQPPHKPGVLIRVKTIGVISSGGLTTVNVKNRGFAGNIHSGARPPWLRGNVSDVDIKSQGMMGPSEVEFKKHLEQQRKSKLNPSRVGANFDHSSPTNEEWLPSFGRVWNAGRRCQSRHQFRKEVGKSKNWKSHHPAPSTASKPP